MGEEVEDVEGSESQVGSARTMANEYIPMIRRNWWVVVTGALGASILALALSLLQTPEYQASASLYVTSGASNNEATSAYQGSLASQQRALSYASLVNSNAIVDRVVENANLQIDRDEVRDSLSADAKTDTVLLTISARNPDKRIATAIVDAASAAMVDYVQTLEKPTNGGAPLAKLTVVTPATPGEAPVSPDTKRNVITGFVIGALLAVLGVLAWERLTNVVRTEADLGLIAGPILSVVGDADSLSGRATIDFGAGAGAGGPAEAYRKMRTNLAFVRVDNPARRILITSSSEGEGKTTTTVNLAAVLAEAGERVIVVSADLRRPSLETRLGATSDIGLTNVLSGEAEVSEVIQQTGISRVDILASGPIPPNPAELVGTTRMSDCLQSLSTAYDYVLVDSPPILPVTDPAVLSRWTDGVIVVVAANTTKVPNLIEGLSQLKAVRANLLGLVLNKAKSGISASPYSYYATAKQSE